MASVITARPADAVRNGADSAGPHGCATDASKPSCSDDVAIAWLLAVSSVPTDAPAAACDACPRLVHDATPGTVTRPVPGSQRQLVKPLERELFGFKDQE